MWFRGIPVTQTEIINFIFIGNISEKPLFCQTGVVCFYWDLSML
ncbi:hypothetical protein D3OALGA1CA_3669 [Olavius algarvensis associated proteobacterium Delta 3]|nr:hypothetical protein D3OALGA1CA_3669 [Olavius algarvensis associated proteobacterium Delta 3]